MNIEYGRLQTALMNQGHRFFSTGDYNLNLVGIRCQDKDTNTFNDQFVVAFKSHGSPHVFSFPCTTDPGLYYLLHPMNERGCAILKPGQYPALWSMGKHQGKYEALVQTGKASVYRDNNKNSSIDYWGAIDNGFHGINCHRHNAKGTGVIVDKSSAGCQVIANAEDYALLMALCRKSVALYGNSFTYTLIDETDY